MGIYINPRTDDPHGKRAMIAVRAARKLSSLEMESHVPGQDDLYGVAVVDNGPFSAAGIAFDEREAHDFTCPVDPRPREYYLLHVDAIRELDEHAYNALVQLRSRPGTPHDAFQ